MIVATARVSARASARARVRVCLLAAVASLSLACSSRHASAVGSGGSFELVVTKRSDPRAGVYLVGDRGKLLPALPRASLGGTIRSGFPIANGSAVLVMVQRDDETWAGLYRLALSRGSRVTATRLSAVARGELVGASDDGRVAVLAEPLGRVGTRAEVHVWRAAGHPELATPLTLRYHAGGDVAQQGGRALVSGVPATCTESWIGRCPMRVFTLDLASVGAGVREIPGGAYADYQPRFGATLDTIVYQTTANDRSPQCATNINACRHDLVTRDFWARTPPRPLRAGGLAWASAANGKTELFLSHATCRRLPCDRLVLYASRDGGAHKPIARDVANFAERWVSADGSHTAYVRNATNALDTHIVATDGTGDVALGDVMPLGWLRVD